MALQVFLFLLVFFYLLILALLWCLDWLPLQPSYSRGVAKRSTRQRLASPPTSGAGPAPTPVRPWSEVKSRRGAPKRVNTDGYACPNQQCYYFGNTDARVHALVGDGKHGRAEQIQTFRCQACRATFSARRNTPLYRLKTPSDQVAMVLSALAEGLDPSAASRVLGSRQATITSLSDARGLACSEVAQAVLLPSPPPTHPAGRTAHPAPQPYPRPVAVAGHRPHDETASRPASGPPHARRRA
jgi:hypothetical protein